MVSYYKLEKDGEATTPSAVTRFKKKRKSYICVLDELHGYFSKMVIDLIAQSRR